METDDDVTEILKDVVVPKKFFERISLGVQVLDEVFGGVDMPGILPGSSFLFTGSPGAGKSTMCLQLADLLQKHAGMNVLYNIGEENKHMIKLRADRLKLTGDFALSQKTEVTDLVKYAKNIGAEVVFQDSLQSLKDADSSGPKMLKSIVKKLNALSKENDVTVFIIGHITKGGWFAGPQEIKHDVDGHAHLRLNKDSGNRIFELEKNRFGPALMPFEFALSANGLDFHPVEEVVVQPGTVSSAAVRRELVRNIIREKLLAGEKVSSYCFERFGVDCSGGFWRGMLAKTCKELEAEGHVVREVKINGRNHNFILGTI